ncbi:MAG TPA: leucyl aminopeptidase [Polyangia bacterium]|jgi:leucyl aminopeptidase|nr:leucyl aminopeptidase [Polyangia bacterium]
MEISFSAADPLLQPLSLLALVFHQEATADDPTLAAADRALDGSLRRAILEERFRGRAGQTLLVHTQGRLAAERLMLIGLGKRSSSQPADMRPAAGRAARAAASVGASKGGLVLLPVAADPEDEPSFSDIQALAEGALLGAYRFDKYLSGDNRPPEPLAALLIFSRTAANNKYCAAAARTLARAQETARAVAMARDLVNEPAAVMTPTRMAETARELAHAAGLEFTVLGPTECRERGMGLFLAVSQGSDEEPRFIHLAWKPAAPRKRIVLVGKGVTFDSGGLSLKTNDGMLDMKVDMAGAAAVLSAIGAVAREKLPVEVHALAACTENMPSGRSYKLGDVLRSMAGKTVEINNTDAEGRLTLADALTYGLALKPDIVIDFATLTGACVVALGQHTAGVMSNNEALSVAWLNAARAAGEEMWPLPLPGRLSEQLKSEIADMKNTGERWGGALTAGHFLKEFVGETPWVHVDIAGPASADKEFGHIGKGGTGFAVASILRFIRDAAGGER